MPQKRWRKFSGNACANSIDGEAGCVAGKNGMLAEMRRYFFIQLAFPVHALGDGFDHDVAILEQLKVLVVVRGLDGGCLGCDRQWRGILFFQILYRLDHIGVGVALLRGQLE